MFEFTYTFTMDDVVKMISEEVYDTLQDDVKHGYYSSDLSDLTSADERGCIEANVFYLVNRLTAFHTVYVDGVLYDYENLTDLLIASVDMEYVREKLKEDNNA